MSTNEPTSTSPKPSPAGGKLIRVRGVRATPGGPVWVTELVDGWATFPDWGTGSRRFQWIGGVLLVVLIAVQFPLVDNDGPLQLQIVNGGIIIALIVALWVTSQISDDRKMIARRKQRNQSMLRAGGKQALRSAINAHGRARTVGEMNILLGSIGRTDPVFSRRRIHKTTIDHRWWRTTVQLTLTGDHTLTYRAYGVRAPAKLARIFESAQTTGQHQE